MRFKATIGFLMIGAFALVYGCQSSTRDKGDPSNTDVQKIPTASSEKAGSELWSENCTRRHNARPPDQYSDAQWDVIVHHMRLRANLTGGEARTIAEFLKSAN